MTRSSYTAATTPYRKRMSKKYARKKRYTLFRIEWKYGDYLPDVRLRNRWHKASSFRKRHSGGKWNPEHRRFEWRGSKRRITHATKDCLILISIFTILFSYHQTIAQPTSPNYRMKSLHTITPRKETIVQFSKFALVGVLNTAISLAVFYLLYNLFSINYPIANLVSYIIGVINSFFWNKLWVFRRGSGNMVRESLIFLLVFAVSYSIQYISLWGMVEVAGIKPQLGPTPCHGRLYDSKLLIESLRHIQKINRIMKPASKNILFGLLFIISISTLLPILGLTHFQHQRGTARSHCCRKYARRRELDSSAQQRRRYCI